MTDLADLSAAQLARAYARGALSPVEVTKAVLARVEAAEPRLNAMYVVSRDKALAAAKASETRHRAKTPHSALDGVPVTVKENLATAGDPCPVGVPIADMTPRVEDSPVPARLREAGAVIIGKTTMPDFGMLSSGLSSLHGVTRNPWDLTKNTAGSSSGAGAAAAAGYGPLHIGTDIGGSVRLPSNHCGVFGLKPSLGRVPIAPPYLGRVAGPMTRHVRDAAMLMNVIARPDVRDFMNLPYDGRDYLRGLDRLSLKGLRIGLITDMPAGLSCDPEVTACVTAAAAALAASGADVTPQPGFLTMDMLTAMERFFEARSHLDVGPMPEEKRRKILPYIVEWATWRAKDFSGSDVMAAYNMVMAMREAAVRAVSRVDFVLTPVAPIVNYPAEWASPTNDPRRALLHIPFTVPFNMSEQPAASVPWTLSREGLPIGVQIVGQRFDDYGVLRLARALEKIRPKQPDWPRIA